MTKYTSLEQLPKFESINDALDENEIRIGILRHIGGDENNALADRLMDCCEGINSCNSLACKVCNRKFRLKRVDELVVKKRNGKIKWWFVTLVDYSRAFKHSELRSFDLKKSKDRLRKLLKRSGFNTPVFGSIEIDYHESCQLWLPHFHLIMPISKKNRMAKKVLEQKLSLLQPHHIKIGRKARPSQFDLIKKPYTQVSYAYKLVFFRIKDWDCKYLGKAMTKKYRLESKMFCDSLRWMDAQGRRSVLFSYNERGW